MPPNLHRINVIIEDLESESTPLMLNFKEVSSYQHQPCSPLKHNDKNSTNDGRLQNIVEIAGNVLEWYDFAMMGYCSDILGDLFFPHDQQGHAALIESFAVFGGAFLMRPIGGVLMGYLGDVYGSKAALKASIFLMAFPTFLMGFAPTYEQAGAWSWVILIGVRLLQGISAGGQLMSSLVYSLERHPKETWGYRGSLTMASANFGTFLCASVDYVLRQSLSKEQLYQFGWRIPFISGILLAFCGFFLELYCEESPAISHCHSQSLLATKPQNPILLAFAKKNLRQLFAACMIPMLWSGGFWFTFTWIPIDEMDLIEHPIHQAMGINSCALLLSVCFLFPLAGILSDRFGRRRIMTVGAIAVGVLSPFLVIIIGQGQAWLAFLCQSLMGICLSFWGAPMMAWMVESFDPEARLTSAEIGYNIGQALAGGTTLATATWIADRFGKSMPGFWLTGLATIALTGLWCVAPSLSPQDKGQHDDGEGCSDSL